MPFHPKVSGTFHDGVGLALSPLASVAAARALGVDPDESKSTILTRFTERGENPLPTKTVTREEAPVKQVVITGDDIDISNADEPMASLVAPSEAGTYIIYLQVNDGAESRSDSMVLTVTAS